MDLKTACKIIGVTEDCSMDELTERYYALTEKRLPRDEIEEIQEAYNVLHAHVKETTPEPDIPFKKRMSDFFYVYKTRIFFGTIIAVVLGLFSYTFIGAQIERIKEARLPPPAVEIMFFGSYEQNADLTSVEEGMLQMFPEWERVKLEIVYSPNEVHSEMDFAAQQRSTAELTMAEPDIFILDKEHFDAFVTQWPFVQLDQFEDEVDTEDKWLVFQKEDDEREHIYGIDLTDHELFAGTEVAQDKKIAVVREDENLENALEFLSEAIQ